MSEDKRGKKNAQGQDRRLGQPPRPLTEEVFKEMWMLRYQQHLGQITFRELLDKWEEILGIKKPPLPQK